MNFLYCFDENYNSQGFSSMISLLDNVSEKINIYLIHNTKKVVNDFPKLITTHKNLNSINIYEFNDNNHYFPNLSNSHVSAATYYRLFIENYLGEHLDLLVYLDADLICMNDPIPLLKEEFRNLDQSNYVLSAKTELDREDVEEKYLVELEMPFERLEVSERYFNAGVLLINFNKWREENYTEKLIKRLSLLKDNIIMWDQDVLNSLVDGKYSILEQKFNFSDSDYENQSKEETDNIIFLHFVGNTKPWKINGAFRPSSQIYHKNYRKVHSNKFHIVHTWKRNSVKGIIKAIRNGSFSNIENKVRYLYEFVKSLTFS